MVSISLLDGLSPAAVSSIAGSAELSGEPTGSTSDGRGGGGSSIASWGGGGMHVNGGGMAHGHREGGLSGRAGNAASALQDYKAKAKALRAREFELERSLRALSRYSAHTQM